MPHALAVRHLVVGDDERDAYLERLATRRASAAACGVHFWAFEHEAERGRFIEFVETADRGALSTALTQDALVAETLDFRVAPTQAETHAAVEVYLELATSSDSH